MGDIDSEEILAQLTPTVLRGSVSRVKDRRLFSKGSSYRSESEQDRLVYTPDCDFDNGLYLTYDFLVENTHSVRFEIVFQSDAGGLFRRIVPGAGNRDVWRVHYGGVKGCAGRMIVALDAMNQNQWSLEQNGAFLKPVAGGNLFPPSDIDRFEITTYSREIETVRWSQTPVYVTETRPPSMEDPPSLEETLVDRFGQYALDDWVGKSATAEETNARLRSQRVGTDGFAFPEGYSRYGGAKDTQTERTGYFQTHHDGERWWLIDPDGHPFWSSGINNVWPSSYATQHGLENIFEWLPDPNGEFADAYEQRGDELTVNYLIINLIRAFGSNEWFDAWAEITSGFLKQLGINTVDGWSDKQTTPADEIPYIRHLPRMGEEVPTVYRDFPDVFSEKFELDVKRRAETLAKTNKDGWMVGYFIDNEPAWFFGRELPAAGMLRTTSSCATRIAFAEFLQTRYDSERELSNSWGREITFTDIKSGRWKRAIPSGAKPDLKLFSSRMADRLYGRLCKACRRVDENHINFGTRLPAPPPEWLYEGIIHFDVLSLNNYSLTVPVEAFESVSDELGIPVLVSEWSVGGDDVGLNAGMANAGDQHERAAQYRQYFDTISEEPWCVGGHYYRLYDQPVVGNMVGENQNVGLFDICNRLYPTVSEMMRRCNEQLYSSRHFHHKCDDRS